MAVYERIWRRYGGRLTPVGRRWTVITRYALAEAFSSRFFTAFYVLCLLPTVAGAITVYLSSNTELLASVQGLDGFVRWLTAVFVEWLFIWQAIGAYLVVVIVAPGLIARDVSNSALSVILARPISRTQYVIGKIAALFVVLSPMTWVSGLIVTGLCITLGVRIDGLSNLRLAAAYLLGHLVWFIVISLLALAISAWVRFIPAARGALFGIIFILAGFAQAVNAVTGTAIGDLVHLSRAIGNIGMWIVGLPPRSDLPIAASWLTLVAACALSLWMLHRKLRAHEVVE